MTQEKLAEKIDMDIPNLSNIENGKRFVTSENIEKLAKALNVKVRDLFDYEHIETQDELLKSLVAFLKNLNKNELKYIYKMVRALKEYDI